MSIVLQTNNVKNFISLMQNSRQICFCFFFYLKNMNDSSVVVIVGLRAGRPRNRGSFPIRGTKFLDREFFLQKQGVRS
jgi:hypothetical protein